MYNYKDNLESSRLITRFLTPDDIDNWAEFFENEEALAFLATFNTLNHEENAGRWIQRQLDRYESQRFGLQLLIDKKTGNVVGQCGLLKQDINDTQEIEVGYHILKKYWGHGYAPEAAKLFIDFAFENNITTEIVSLININNVKSQRVAEKNKLQRGIQTKWRDLDIYIYRLKKENT